jgi:hypothetical protein
MYADTERGPIGLPRELFPEGSKRNWAGNQVYNPIYEVSPINKEQAKQVLLFFSSRVLYTLFHLLTLTRRLQ